MSEQKNIVLAVSYKILSYSIKNLALKVYEVNIIQELNIILKILQRWSLPLCYSQSVPASKDKIINVILRTNYKLCQKTVYICGVARGSHCMTVIKYYKSKLTLRYELFRIINFNSRNFTLRSHDARYILRSAICLQYSSF